ncbi:MAG TPA: DUF4258 domain-containing protein [Methanothrix sp.]|nr:DUF4258 domain-containing protein [Methanothrix sp.]
MPEELIYAMRSLAIMGRITFTDHAKTRMFERGIESDAVIDLILNGEIIEVYPEGMQCPSALILGSIESQACHVVAALCRDRVKIVTAYWPDEGEWLDSRTRKCV